MPPNRAAPALLALALLLPACREVDGRGIVLERDEADGADPTTEVDSNQPETELGEADAGCTEGCLGNVRLQPSVECQDGEAYCDEEGSSVRCLGGSWSEPTTCDFACLNGTCAGDCAPGSTECLNANRYRECGADGTWLEEQTCEFACFGLECSGECLPGSRRCASDAQVQVCSSAGEWGPIVDCEFGCAGSSCAAECAPGSQICVNETLLQACDDAGQWLEPSACEFACANAACTGECAPGSARCEPQRAVPQSCDEAGQWRDGAACALTESCLPGGSCGCAPGEGRCGVECADLSRDPNHCGACNAACETGQCENGRCRPAALATGETNLSAVALSDTHVYFRSGSGNAATIRRVPKAGGPTETVLSGLGALSAPALGGDQIYVVGLMPGAAARQALRSNLDGTALIPFSPVRAQDIELVIAPGLFVYYTTRAATTTVFRASLLSEGDPGAAQNEAQFANSPGPLSSLAVINGCLFTVDQPTPNELRRKCNATAAAALRYTGVGALSFFPQQMNDQSFLYVLDAGRGTLRVPLNGNGPPQVVSNQNVGTPSVHDSGLYYFVDTAPGGACGTEHVLFRDDRAPGGAPPSVVLPAPNACPTQVAIDDDALYWSTTGDGNVWRLPI